MNLKISQLKIIQVLMSQKLFSHLRIIMQIEDNFIELNSSKMLMHKKKESYL